MLARDGFRNKIFDKSSKIFLHIAHNAGIIMKEMIQKKEREHGNDT